MTTIERKSKKWWAVNNNDVGLVTGWSCAPNNPDSWWCPQVGYTMQEKFHLFETEAEALDKAITETEQEVSILNNALKKLNRRRNAL